MLTTQADQKKEALKVRKRCASNVRLLRKVRGVSQTELGKVLGLEQAAISRIEQGKQTLAAEELYLLAAFFKTTADALLNEDLASKF